MVVLITGSSRGLGRETAILFAKNGYDIVINYNNNLNDALTTEEVVLKYNVETLVVKCDVSNEKEVSNMVDTIYNKFGYIDCVVNNAGICNDTLPFEKNIKDFKRIMDVNVIGTYLVSKYASKYMKKGVIINVASNNALNDYYPMSLDYDASKAGVISLTHNLAVLLSPNIRVNAVAPGWIKTDMSKDLTDDFIKNAKNKILIKRFAETSEVSEVIYFLASSKASYINNSIIRVDGGLNGSC